MRELGMPIRLALLFVAAALAACSQRNSAPSAAPAVQSAAPSAAQAAAPPSGMQPAAAADVLPTTVGQCAQTTVKSVGTRLDGTPGSGSAISYSNGGGQVSYDQIPGIDGSQAGDAITLCLVSLPQNCPPGDDRGKVYSATNQRTGATWTEADSEHSCGGA
jgi:hypothetical protein